MRKLYFLLIIFTSSTINSQVVFDFQNDQDLGGWVSGGGGITDADLNITSEGLEISWGDPGETSWTNGRKPKIKHLNANIDADNLKIFAISLHNTSSIVTRVRVLHFKGLNGSDPSSSNGSDTRYTSFDIPSSTDPQSIYYFDLTNVDWVNYNHSSETETNFDMDHIQIQLVTAPSNGFLNSSGSLTIHKIEFLENIPSESRIDYTFDVDSEGFIGQNGVSVNQSDGNLILDISDSSPYPKLTQSGVYFVDADIYKFVTVYLLENNSPKSRMTFVSPLGGNQFISADIVPNTDSSQEVNFDISTLDNWNGEVNNFAFQIIEPSTVEGESPITSAGSVSIDRILFSTENPLSINDELFEIKFDIYPNPANQYLNISTNSEVISLSVTNLLGQEIYFQTENLNFINLSDFSNGIYILKASLEKDYFITRKFIVNK